MSDEQPLQLVIAGNLDASRPDAEVEAFLAEVRAELMRARAKFRSEEHTSELQSLMRISYAVFCLKKKNNKFATDVHKPTITITNNINTSIHITYKKSINNLRHTNNP